MSTNYKNVVQIKQLGKENYKITILRNHNIGKKNDVEKAVKDQKKKFREQFKHKLSETVESDKEKKKMAQSISRTKKQVLEKALCNEWTWFATLTLSPEKYKRDDLDTFRRDLSQFIRDYRKKSGTKVQYLLIPELHADKKNWHMHGLFSEIPFDDIEIHPVQKLSDKGYFNWLPYSKKFGFCSLGAIRDDVRTALYITKYITKSIATEDNDKRLNKSLYYCSQGLKVAEKVKEGILTKPLNFEMAFEGLYSQSMFVNSIEWFEQYFEEKELEDVSIHYGGTAL